MAWKKIGQAQKSKIFTVFNGQRFRLREFTEGVLWGHRIVLGQVSSIFMDRPSASGIKAIVNHLGDDLYQAWCQAMDFEITGSQIHIEHMQKFSRGDYSPFRQILQHQTQNFGTTNYRGVAISAFIPIQNGIDGHLQVRVGGTVIENKHLWYQQNNTHWEEFSNSLVPNIHGEMVVYSTINSICYYWINPYVPVWNGKSGNITVFASESTGSI